jgi:hypothetical protein
MRELINIKGRWYNVLCTCGGRVYGSNLLDLDNEVEFSGVIWENQPFYYHSEVWYGKIFINIVRLLRKIKNRILC